MAKLRFQFWPFTTTKLRPIAKSYYQRRFNFFRNARLIPKNCQRFFFCQSGKVSPNLITLLTLCERRRCGKSSPPAAWALTSAAISGLEPRAQTSKINLRDQYYTAIFAIIELP